jgi:predicted DNA-binding ribbon-helix-helix protein
MSRSEFDLDLPDSTINKHSISMNGFKTSFSIEDVLWRLLKLIAEREELPIGSIIMSIDNRRNHKNLSSSVRIYLVKYILSNSFDKAFMESLMKEWVKKGDAQ